MKKTDFEKNTLKQKKCPYCTTNSDNPDTYLFDYSDRDGTTPSPTNIEMY